MSIYYYIYNMFCVNNVNFLCRRKSQKLVHQLEYEPNKMIKCYSRSTAGRSLNKPHLLRPLSIMKDTISYLLNE